MLPTRWFPDNGRLSKHVPESRPSGTQPQAAPRVEESRPAAFGPGSIGRDWPFMRRIAGKWFRAARMAGSGGSCRSRPDRRATNFGRVLPCDQRAWGGKCRRHSGHSTARDGSLKPALSSSGCRAIAIDRLWDNADVRMRHVERQLLS